MAMEKKLNDNFTENEQMSVLAIKEWSSFIKDKSNSWAVMKQNMLHGLKWVPNWQQPSLIESAGEFVESWYAQKITLYPCPIVISLNICLSAHLEVKDMH